MSGQETCPPHGFLRFDKELPWKEDDLLRFPMQGRTYNHLPRIMPMTLHAYEPCKLDQFALRLLDMASAIRDMANRSREYGIMNLVMHDKKALEWCDKLEQWAHRSRTDLELRILQDKADRRKAGDA